MRRSMSMLAMVVLTTTLAIGLAGCTTSGRAPVNSSNLAGLVDPLPGTKGKTLEDQRNIDRSVAVGCSTKVLKPAQCDLQTRASAERKVELRNGS